MMKLLVLAVIFFAYWYPALLAFRRHHLNKGCIMLVNLFFGWTGLGWIVALIWAASSNVAET